MAPSHEIQLLENIQLCHQGAVTRVQLQLMTRFIFDRISWSFLLKLYHQFLIRVFRRCSLTLAALAKSVKSTLLSAAHPSTTHQSGTATAGTLPDHCASGSSAVFSTSSSLVPFPSKKKTFARQNAPRNMKSIFLTTPWKLSTPC